MTLPHAQVEERNAGRFAQYGAGPINNRTGDPLIRPMREDVGSLRCHPIAEISPHHVDRMVERTSQIAKYSIVIGCLWPVSAKTRRIESLGFVAIATNAVARESFPPDIETT